MKSKKILTQSILVIVAALYFQASQACDLTDESEDLLTISASAKDRAIDTESYKFKMDGCQHKQSAKAELHGDSYANQTHTVNSHKMHLNMIKHHKQLGS